MLSSELSQTLSACFRVAIKIFKRIFKVEESNLMKTIFRFLSVGLLLTAFVAVGSIAAFAQAGCDDTATKTDLDSKFRNNYNSPDRAKRQIAVDAGKQYIEKFGECADSKDFVDYLKSYIPPMEARIQKEKKDEDTKGRYDKYNAAYKTQNWDGVYAAGKEILAAEPDNLDVILDLGSIGYDQSINAKNYKYNDDTVRYAKLAIEKLKSGKTCERCGAFYAYKSKDNALGWMNLTIGYIMYNVQNNKKEALPYLFAASQANSDTKNNPLAYDPVGAYFYEDVKKLVEETQNMIKTTLPETATDEEKAKREADIKAKIALLNGTTERAMDAYAHAYNAAKANGKQKAYADGVYKKLQDLYNLRFQKTDGFDTYIASLTSKPMTDPTQAVTPVADTETTPVSASTTTTPAPVAEKPTAATAKAVTPTAKPSESTTATKAKAATTVKKPVAKKKGTR